MKTKTKENNKQQIGEFIAKNDRFSIGIVASRFNGKLQVDIRYYYIRDGEHRPTRKGVAIPFKELDNVIAVLKKMSKNKQSVREASGEGCVTVKSLDELEAENDKKRDDNEEDD